MQPIQSINEFITELQNRGFWIDAQLLLRLHYLVRRQNVDFSDVKSVYQFSLLIQGIVCKTVDDQYIYTKFLEEIEPPGNEHEDKETGPDTSTIKDTPEDPWYLKFLPAFLVVVVILSVIVYTYNSKYCNHHSNVFDIVGCYCKTHLDSLSTAIVDSSYRNRNDSIRTLKASIVHSQVVNRWIVKDPQNTIVVQDTSDSIAVNIHNGKDLYVTLITTSGDMSDTAYSIITTPLICTADFSVPPVKSFNDKIQFTDNSIGNNLVYQWDFGDGTQSSERNPLHQFKNGESFEVQLKVENDSCSSSITQTVAIADTVDIPLLSIAAPPPIDVDISDYAEMSEHIFTPEEIGVKVYFIIIILNLLFVFLYTYPRRFIRSRRQKPLPELEGPFYKALNYNVKHRMYENDELQNIIKAWRSKKQTGYLKVDIERTITETINNAGLFTVCHYSSTQIPEYLLLIKCDNQRNHHFHLIKNLFDELSKFIAIDAYIYEHDIRELAGLYSRKKYTLKDLHVTNADNRLIVWSDGYELIDSEGQWLNTDQIIELSVWNERALFTPVQPELWSEREIILSGFFILESSSTQGMVSLISDLKEYDFYSIKSKVADLCSKLNNLSDFPDIDPYLLKISEDKESEQLIAEGYIQRLQWYFEDDPRVFQLLACCSLHEYLYWDLTRQLALDLYPEQQLLTDEVMVQLNYLIWFRQGYIPVLFREALIKRINPEIKQIAYDTIKKVIQYNLNNRKLAGADAVKSYADFNLHVSIAAVGAKASSIDNSEEINSYREYLPDEVIQNTDSSENDYNIDQQSEKTNTIKTEVYPEFIRKLKIRFENRLKRLQKSIERDETAEYKYRFFLYIIKANWQAPFIFLAFTAAFFIARYNTSVDLSRLTLYKNQYYDVNDTLAKARFYSKVGYDLITEKKYEAAYDTLIKSDSLQKNDTTLHNLNVIMAHFGTPDYAEKNYKLYENIPSASLTGCIARVFTAVSYLNYNITTLKKESNADDLIQYLSCIDSLQEEPTTDDNDDSLYFTGANMYSYYLFLIALQQNYNVPQSIKNSRFENALIYAENLSRNNGEGFRAFYNNNPDFERYLVNHFPLTMQKSLSSFFFGGGGSSYNDSSASSIVQNLSFPVELKIINGDFSNTEVTVSKNDNMIFSLQGSTNMRLKLALNNQYNISFSKPGYITKTISINTDVIRERMLDVFRPKKVSIELYKMYEGVNVDVYKKPVAHVKFNTTIDDFNSNNDYTLSRIIACSATEGILKSKAEEERKRAKTGTSDTTMVNDSIAFNGLVENEANGAGISNVKVQDANGRIVTTTDVYGRFSFNVLKNSDMSKWSLSISGWEPKQLNQSINASGTSSGEYIYRLKRIETAVSKGDYPIKDLMLPLFTRMLPGASFEQTMEYYNAFSPNVEPSKNAGNNNISSQLRPSNEFKNCKVFYFEKNLNDFANGQSIVSALEQKGMQPLNPNDLVCYYENNTLSKISIQFRIEMYAESKSQFGNLSGMKGKGSYDYHLEYDDDYWYLIAIDRTPKKYSTVKIELFRKTGFCTPEWFEKFGITANRPIQKK